MDNLWSPPDDWKRYAFVSKTGSSSQFMNDSNTTSDGSTELNPYSPPSAGEESETGIVANGVYRDGNRMVVDTANHHFENICVKTGITADSVWVLEDRAISQKIWMTSFAMCGLIGVWFAKRWYGRPVKLSVPIEQEWMERATSSAAAWTKILQLAFVVLVLSILLSVFTFTSLLQILILLSMVATVAISVYTYRKCQARDAPLRVRRRARARLDDRCACDSAPKTLPSSVKRS